MKLFGVYYLSLLLTTEAGETNFNSPIKHLEASIAASTAYSTIVAIQCDECLILVSRSPSKETCSLMSLVAADVDTSNFQGLTICSGTPKRWLQLTQDTVCTMTGFTPDIQHLTGVIKRQVESHQSLYSEPHSIHLTMRELATVMRRTAQREGSRPFGVQALMVGRDAGGWQTYTVDPSGLWRHFASGATAIGRHADKVKEELKEALKERKSRSAKDGLDIAVESIMKGVSMANEKDVLDSYEALLIQKDDQGHCETSRISSHSIDECYQSSIKQLLK